MPEPTTTEATAVRRRSVSSTFKGRAADLMSLLDDLKGVPGGWSFRQTSDYFPQENNTICAMGYLETGAPVEEPAVNAELGISLDGEPTANKDFANSLYAEMTYRVEADELLEALERGHLDITVTIKPLESR
jgi:hypothetical protein